MTVQKRTYLVSLLLSICGILLLVAAAQCLGPTRYAEKYLDLIQTMQVLSLLVGVVFLAYGLFGREALALLAKVECAVQKVCGESRERRRAAAVCLTVCILTYIAAYGTFTILRHNRLNSAIYDLAIEDQVIWNTLQGRFLESSLEAPKGEFRSFLSDHFSLAHLLFVPFYVVWCDVRMLLLAQTAMLAAGAIPVYLLAKHKLDSTFLGLAFGLLYLFYPPVGFVNRYDFHPVATVIPLFLWAVYLIERDRYWTAAVPLALALVCKEDIGVTVSALGVYLAVCRKRPGIGALWTGLGLGVSAFALLVAIPHFRGGPPDALSRYRELGSSPSEVVLYLLRHPWYLFREVFVTNPYKAAFIVKMLLPVGFLSLLDFRLLLVSVPAFLYNLISSSPSQNSIYFQYVSPLVPFVITSAICGFGVLRRNETRIAFALRRLVPAHRSPTSYSVAFLPVLALFCLAALSLDCPFTKAITVPYWEVYALERRPNEAAFREATRLIPADASVDTIMPFGPHLSHRRDLRLVWPGGFMGLNGQEFVLVDLDDYRWCQSDELSARLFLLRVISEAIERRGYGVRYFEGGVLLLQEGLRTPEVTKRLRAELRRRHAKQLARLRGDR